MVTLQKGATIPFTMALTLRRCGRNLSIRVHSWQQCSRSHLSTKMVLKNNQNNPSRCHPFKNIQDLNWTSLQSKSWICIFIFLPLKLLEACTRIPKQKIVNTFPPFLRRHFPAMTLAVSFLWESNHTLLLLFFTSLTNLNHLFTTEDLWGCHLSVYFTLFFFTHPWQ